MSSSVTKNQHKKHTGIPFNFPPPDPPDLLHKQAAEQILKQAQVEVNEVDSSDLPDDLKSSQKYRIMKLAFDDVIEESKSYRDVFKAIKTSYDDYIQTLEQDSSNSVMLSNKLKHVAARPATLANLRKRGDQLEDNVQKLRIQNHKLKDELFQLEQQMHSARNSPDEYAFGSRLFASHSAEKLEAVHPSPRKSAKPLLQKMKLEDTFDVEKLQETLRGLTSQLDVLKEAQKTKFISKDEHEAIWREYSKTAEQKAVLESTYNDLQKEFQLVSVANEATKNYLANEPIGKTIAAHVYDSLVNAFKQSIQGSLSEELSDLDNNEASSMIEHIEHFHILFDEKRYEQAAWHASRSPKGVLRNVETFRKFKEVDNSEPETMAVYHYAKAYMTSLSSEFLSSRLPNEEMSSAFVRAVMKAGEDKLVYQWFHNGWLKSSKDIADLLACDKHSKIHGTVVAEEIYMRLGLYNDAIRCMAFRGDIPAAISFAQETACFGKEDYVDLLMSVPSVKLAKALSAQKYPGTNKVLLPCGQVALLLVKEIDVSVLGEFLKCLDFNSPILRNEGETEVSGNGDKDEVAWNCIFGDAETTEEDWMHVVTQLEHTDYEGLGVEIVSSLCLHKALKSTLAPSK